MTRLRSVCVVAAVVGIAASTAGASPALAAKVKSHVIVKYLGQPVTSATVISLTQLGGPVTVTAELDSGCPSVFEHSPKQDFGIVTAVDVDNVVTVSPSRYDDLACSD